MNSQSTDGNSRTKHGGVIMTTENRETLRILAGVLLIISSITHTLQVFIFGGVWHNIGAALYGLMYLFFGIGLVWFNAERRDGRWRLFSILLLVSIFMPAIGGSGAVLRFFMHLESEGVANFFIPLHILIDIVVVPSLVLVAQHFRTAGTFHIRS
jgi:hypothetical protein